MTQKNRGSDAGMPSGTSAPGSSANAGELPVLLGQLRNLTTELAAAMQILAERLRQPERPQRPVAAAANLAGGGRHLAYVHGICRHDPGYSNPWWDSLAIKAGDLHAATERLQFTYDELPIATTQLTSRRAPGSLLRRFK